MYVYEAIYGGIEGCICLNPIVLFSIKHWVCNGKLLQVPLGNNS